MITITKTHDIIHKTNLIIATFVSLFLALTMASSTYADAATLTATASANSVQINKTFTVTVSVNSDEPVSGVSVCMTFDATEVQLTNTTYGSWSSAAPNDGTCGSAHQVSVYTLAANPPSSGAVVTFTFKAKASSGSSAFAITSNSIVGAKDNGANIMTGSSGDSISFTAPPTPPPSSGGGSSGGGSTTPPPEDKNTDEPAPSKTDDKKKTDDAKDEPVADTTDELEPTTDQPAVTGAESDDADEDDSFAIIPWLIGGGAVIGLAAIGTLVYTKIIRPRRIKASSVPSGVTGAIIGSNTTPASSSTDSSRPTGAWPPSAPSNGGTSFSTPPAGTSSPVPQSTATPNQDSGSFNQPPKIQ